MMKKSIYILLVFLLSCNSYRFPADFPPDAFIWNSLDYNPIGEGDQLIIIRLSTGQEEDSLFLGPKGAFTLLSNRRLNSKNLKYYLYNKINDWDTIMTNNLDSMRINDTIYDPLKYNKIVYFNDVDSVWQLGKCRFISYYFTNGYLKDFVSDEKMGHIIYLLYRSKVAIHNVSEHRLYLPIQYTGE
jgi:hypothetical protein